VSDELPDQNTTPPTVPLAMPVGAPTDAFPPPVDRAAEPDTRRQRRGSSAGGTSWWPLALGIGVGLVFVVAALWLGQRIDKYELHAGSVRDTTGLIAVDGTEIYDPEGELALTTVGINRDVRRFQKLWADLTDDADREYLEPEVIDGDRTPEEAREQNEEAMVQSQDAAVVVALSYLGFAEPEGAQVLQTVPGTPGEELLDPGDVIVAVDGQPVTDDAALGEALIAFAPGESVTLSVRKGAAGDPVDIEATLVERPPPEPGQEPPPEDVARAGFLGVALQTFAVIDAPFEVSIDAGNIAGPSGGLAFTLGIIDLLTDGELTGDTRVAMTGEIRGDGSVGPIGGIRHKVTAAKRLDYELFLSPAANYAEAIAYAGDDIEVRCVDTAADAMLLLEEFGGNASDVVELPLVATEPVINLDDQQVTTCAEALSLAEAPTEAGGA
jgi:Lon-like protease